ncbi:SHOCT domain-containing protein [Lactococcus insecticola]|uniref:SHOCT-like domain-containing protein n=1 Tax=Pseudolactococcus insecticola TaxID=2709158 RepID=A0A6A0B4F1_9LACT|nr:SHOCT domain-containing protein [Lactococcus insecticola]GFH40220.1 hypothetical protein Hs20B_06180 [Lactococcus insecticola]
MSEKEIKNDMMYSVSLSLAKSMLEKGIVTESDYRKIDAFLLEKYQPYIGLLLADKA